MADISTATTGKATVGLILTDDIFSSMLARCSFKPELLLPYITGFC